jgi:hypothetical protein
MKEYILVLDDVPAHMVPVIAAHASLIAHLEWYNKEEGITFYNLWLGTSFKKCVCKVNKKEFEKARLIEYNKVITENQLGREVAIVLCPRIEWPNVVKFAKLWQP